MPHFLNLRDIELKILNLLYYYLYNKLNISFTSLDVQYIYIYVFDIYHSAG